LMNQSDQQNWNRSKWIVLQSISKQIWIKWIESLWISRLFSTTCRFASSGQSSLLITVWFNNRTPSTSQIRNPQLTLVNFKIITTADGWSEPFRTESGIWSKFACPPVKKALNPTDQQDSIKESDGENHEWPITRPSFPKSVLISNTRWWPYTCHDGRLT
jgi:hypothetical protein